MTDHASLPIRFDTENEGLRYGSSGWAVRDILYFTMTSQKREYPGPVEGGYPKSHSSTARSGVPVDLVQQIALSKTGQQIAEGRL
jgi:hypothetical protein